MSVPFRPRSLFTVAAAAAALTCSIGVRAAAFDAAAAEAMFEDNECTKCHSVDKPKKGPSLKKTAEKYRGKPDAEKNIMVHMTKVQTVKQDDGQLVEHKIIDTKDPKVLKNVALWILSH